MCWMSWYQILSGKITWYNLDNAYVIMEYLCPKFVNTEKVEKFIKATGAVFTWGADTFEELGELAEGYRKVKNAEDHRRASLL